MNEKRYDNNPFVNGMIIPMTGKYIRLSRLGKENNILINQSTGEVHGTHLTTYKKVDSEQFVKLFTSNIALIFDLNKPGIKVFNVLMWSIQNQGIEKDLIPLDAILLNKFLIANETKNLKLSLSTSSFKRGLSELETSQIIAKSLRKGFYYINPNFCFNGDRIAFTTMIEKVNQIKKIP